MWLGCAGEWGGQNVNSEGKADATWHAAFLPYLRQLGATDNFYWCLNPTSSDTGGILQADWATPVAAKMQLLDSLVPQPGRVILTAGVPTGISPGNGQSVFTFATGESRSCTSGGGGFRDAITACRRAKQQIWQ